MKDIRSKDNPIFKHLLAIANQKEDNLCLLEGVHLAKAWLEKKPAINMVVSDSVFAGKFSVDAEIRQIMKEYESSQIILLPDALFKRLTVVASPQGILLVIEKPQYRLSTKFKDNAIALDRVQDPGNLGTILRTAAAAGIGHIILSKGCANPWSDKVLRSAQGAHFGLSIYENVDLTQLKQYNLPLYATLLDDKAHNLYTTTWQNPCIWLFGHEGQGLSAELQEQTDQAFFIPQASAVESLNVAVACSLVLFEQRRRLCNFNPS